MKYAYLNEKLLLLILYIQGLKKTRTYKNELMHRKNDAWDYVRDAYYGLPKTVFTDAGIKRCDRNLDLIDCFIVSDEMMNAQSSDLHKFCTPFLTTDAIGSY